jgi:hypothetical protein
MNPRNLLAAAVLAILSAPAAALPSDIDPDHKHAWGENIGWTNWRDAGDPPASQGVRVHETFLSGFIWGENIGWIDMGSGLPADGVRYGNLDGGDFGVNVDASGDLFGYAWGENVGWIQFDTRSQAEDRARLDREARRFRGYAWGENIGWILLDDEEHFVGLIAVVPEVSFRRGDANDSGRVDLADPIFTIGCLFRGTSCPRCPDAGDANDDGAYNIADAIYTLVWLFNTGAAPPAPGPFACGPDPTEDTAAECEQESCR